MLLSIKNALIKTSALLLLMSACSKGDLQNNPYSNLPEPELEKLASKKYEAIAKLTVGEPCTEAKDWKMMDIQTICGLDHLIYHKTVDKQQLDKLVTDYELVIEVYRPLIAPRISCIAYKEPKGIICRDGQPVLIY